MCFTLIRAALLADRIHTRNQQKQQQQQQQQQYQQQQQPQQYQYAAAPAPYTAEGTTGVISTEKPYQPEANVSQVA
jgi:transcription initiation factor TFIID subunit TAF12